MGILRVLFGGQDVTSEAAEALAEEMTSEQIQERVRASRSSQEPRPTDGPSDWETNQPGSWIRLADR